MLTKKETIKNEVKSSKAAKNASSAAEASRTTSCCSPSSETNHQIASSKTNTTQNNKQQSDNKTPTNKKCCSTTRVTIKYDAGFPNQLYIRGKGANLSWDKGQLLKNVKPDEWLWETDAHFSTCEFKILINDHVYENGDNHHLNAGSALLYTPHFY